MRFKWIKLQLNTDLLAKIDSSLLALDENALKIKFARSTWKKKRKTTSSKNTCRTCRKMQFFHKHSYNYWAIRYKWGAKSTSVQFEQKSSRVNDNCLLPMLHRPRNYVQFLYHGTHITAIHECEWHIWTLNNNTNNIYVYICQQCIPNAE